MTASTGYSPFVLNAREPPTLPESLTVSQGSCVASTDGASAHTAHFLSTTQMSCVLTTIYCKSSVAAGACPTESMEVAETKSDSIQGVPDVPRHRTQNQRRLQHWNGEQEQPVNHSQCSSPTSNPNQHHPFTQIHSFLMSLLPDHKSSTEVLARGLIGTCARLKT